MYSFTEPEESIGELSLECIAYGETGIVGYLVYYKLLMSTAFGNDTGYKMLENSVLPSTADDILYEINSYEALIATEKN